MTPEEYKNLSIKEFTEAAKVYDSGHAGIYEMCKDDYPPILAELEKEPFDRVLDCGCGPAQNRNSLRRCLCSPADKQKGRAPLREHVLLLLT